MEMKTKIAALALSLILPCFVLAHDEGHGPKSTGVRPNKGGIVSAVVNKKDSGKGAKAEGIYWAELIRSGEGTVEIFIYKKDLDKDGRLVPLSLETFAQKAEAELQAKVKGKWKKSSFDLKMIESAFVGKMPKPESSPFNIDVTLKEGKTELLSAFDNLDKGE
jgi:hypothetical protein